ncbi:MAG: endo alpha-1,4 polygalactosaminidase [Bacteroidales bacterium]|nr:endo alpha-1,4 polygalactosaminidase [Bacteroidales bacterium]
MKLKNHNYLICVFFVLVIASCSKEDDIDPLYRQRMREFVTGISQYARANQPDFIVIPQNGIEIITDDGESNGPLNHAYMQAIDGHGQEDLFYGYNNDNELTPVDDADYLQTFLDVSKNAGKTILVTDYCSDRNFMEDSYTRNFEKGYVSFAADHRELDNIPSYPSQPFNSNSDHVNTLAQVKNFLYLINPGGYPSKGAFINAVIQTNYDLLIMDLFFDEITQFTQFEISQIKAKANGGVRLVVCYMSIGEAEDYRYYWQSSWEENRPEWLDKENPDWEGNYKVRYWIKEWQDIIYGNDESYIKKIIEAGFDGVYLDIIEAYEYYE